MLGKLFYYEMKQTSRLLLLLHGIGLLIALAVFGLLSIPGMGNRNPISTLIQGVTLFLLVSMAFFTYFCLAFRFYKSIYTSEGYLTNTLPVTPGQILLSRFFTALIWMFLDILILLICLSLVGKINIFSVFFFQFSTLFEYGGFALLMLILFISAFLTTILTIFCAVSIGNLFGGHKVIGSVVSFFSLNFVLQILSLIPLLFFIRDFAKIPSGSYGIAEFQAAYPEIFQSLETALGIDAILYLLISVVLYWLTWYLLDKKLNLE